MKNLLKNVGIASCALMMMTLMNPGRAAAQAAASTTSVVAMNQPLNNPATIQALGAEAPAALTRMRIGAGDLLNITVFDVPEMGQTVRLDDRGNASLSLLGSVHLAGLTADEAQELIATDLKKGKFLIAPQVTVFIAEYSTQGVSVLGEVAKPGVYQVLGRRTLLDIISEAGGTTPYAGSEATVEHRDGTTIAVAITKDAHASLTTDVQLAPGDKVIIPRASLVYVLGDVGRPGGFIMGNDGRMSILQALAMAGGLNHTSSPNRTRLIHKGTAGYTETALPLKKILDGAEEDSDLQAEDIIYVPSSAAKTLLYRTGPSLTSSVAGAAVYRGFP